VCDFCEKCFTTKYRLQEHLNKTCKEKSLKNQEKEQMKHEEELKKIKNEHKKKEKDLRDEKDKYYGEKITLLNKQYQDKLEEKEKTHQDKIKLLDKQIAELNKRLEKFENVVIDHSKRTGTTNNTSNIIVNNHTMPLTNEVLRQCANTFTMDNAYTLNGITKHLTASLEDHITCTDSSRNVFRYTNDKDEEIVDQNLENLLPQYLTAVKDRNNFFYKEVLDYFEKNHATMDIKMEHSILHNALNNIIQRKDSEYAEKCKKKMVRECRRQFLDKNKNKDKEIAKEMTIDEIMIEIIETGGSVGEFVKRCFEYDIDDETDEEFTHRRKMEDLFLEKKREWKAKHVHT
jgi:hypothetical protein